MLGGGKKKTTPAKTTRGKVGFASDIRTFTHQHNSNWNANQCLSLLARFNYRSTHHMVQEGFYNFLNWFDERAWYPLGRIVGGTVSLLCTLNPKENTKNSAQQTTSVLVRTTQPLPQTLLFAPTPCYLCFRLQVYPGLMITSGTIHWILHSLHIPIHIRDICVFLAPIFR